MKKLSAIIIAMALLLGMSQCKKENTNTAEGKKVYITMKTDAGDRHIVYPGTGAVVYNNGDVIYVGDGSKYIGYLTYGNGTFGGEITAPAEGSYLYFYFLGGQTLTSPSASTTSYTISIADQSEKLPVLSCGKSTTTYTDGNATYSCMLRNKCALVKFGFSSGVQSRVSVTGMKNVATIKFNDTENPIAATGDPGTINLYSESATAKWAILLPQDAVSSAPVRAFGYSGQPSVNIPAITANMYSTNDIQNINCGTAYEFTVDDQGTKVQFSPGNLQYIGSASTPYWKFADNQWDCLGTTTGQNSSNTNVDRDLFGWGTWSGTSEQLDPNQTSTTNSDYSWKGDEYFHGFSNSSESGWRTLTMAEWEYLFYDRSDKWGMAEVAGVKGAIILPDDFEEPSGVNSFISWGNGNSDWSDNNYNEDAWAAFQTAGAVFLPAAGFRFVWGVDDVGVRVYYWSSTANEDDEAWYMEIDDSGVSTFSDYGRCYGYSVRLVR